MRRLLLLCLLCAAACRYPNADQHFGLVTDADHDGYLSNVDCNDNDPNVHPGAPETCNGIDDNCNGQIDENPIDPSTFYLDKDGDGYGVTGGDTATGCTPPDGYAAQNGDCNDNNASIHPGATDIPDDGIDQDCNGHDSVTCYVDADHDGYGTDAGTTVIAPDGSCDASQGESDNALDCDDTNPNIHPGATEIPGNGIDENCDGYDTPACYTDLDGDGFGNSLEPVVTTTCDGANQSPVGGDCDDNNANVYPGAPARCDGFQNNCNDWTTATNPGTLPADEIDDDNDGYVECTFAANVTADNWGNAETPPVVGGGDCNDNDATVYPGAPELCDGQIDNCNTATLPADEQDQDGDHYVTCTIDAGGWDGDSSVVGGDDCNDNDNTIYPGAPELCDGKINNCNTSTLPGNEIDNDDDGYVECTFANGVTADNWGNSETPPVIGGGDCNDANASIHPGAPEFCDGVDDNCNGSLDDQDGVVSLEDTNGNWSDLTTDLVVANQRTAYTIGNTVSGTVWLCKGTYYTTLTISSPDLTVEGRYGKDLTTLSGFDPAGGAAKRAIDHSGNGSFTLQGLTVSDCADGGDGAGLHFTGAPTPVLIKNVDVKGGTAGGKGGGIYLDQGDFTLDAVDVYNNVGGAGGGGIWAHGHNGNLTLLLQNGTLISQNKANASGKDGGGIYMEDGTVTLDASTVSGNTADRSGGGIEMLTGTLNIHNGSTIENNTASGTSGEGGGGIASKDGLIDIDDSTITLNHAANNDGGGINAYSPGGNDLITIQLSNNSLITDNTAADQGGGIDCAETCAITLTNSFISGNTATNTGGGVLLKDSGATFTCTGDTAGSAGIYDNTASSSSTSAPLPAGGLGMTATTGASVDFVTNTHCKWGTATGGDDNTPHDLTTPTTAVDDLGDDVTGTCSIGGCL